MIEIGLLVTCFVLAGVSAYAISSRLFPYSLLENFACSLLLFPVFLICPMTVMGLMNLLYPIPVALSSFVLSFVGLYIARRVSPFSPLQTNVQPFRLSRLSRILLILLFSMLDVIVIVELYAYLVPVLPWPLQNVDLQYAYLPMTINFVQDHTLWNFNGIYSYLSYSYEMLIAWGILFAKNYLLTAFIQLLLAAGYVTYNLLIMNLLIRQLSGKIRLFAATVFLIFLVATETSTELFFEIGKNDILVGLGIAASVYYLLRYWSKHQNRDNRYLILVGVGLGLAMSAKFSSFYFIVILAAAHLIALLRFEGIQFWRWRKLAWRHFIYVAVPMFLLMIPWIIRTVSRLDLLRADQSSIQNGMEGRIINMYRYATFMETSSQWFPYFILILLGIALIVQWRPKSQQLNVLLKVAGIVMIALSTYKIFIGGGFTFTLFLAPFYTAVSVLALLVVAKMRRPHLITDSIWVCAVLGLVMMLVLAIMPYSAGGRLQATEYIWRRIWYRYTPEAQALFFAVLVAVSTRALASIPTSNIVLSNIPARRPSKLVVGLGLGLLSLICIFFALPVAPDRQPFYYENHNYMPIPGRTYEPTSVFSWVTHNVKNSSIYSLNVPPGLLYGEQLANHVYYVSPGYSGYDGQQRYKFNELVPFIDEHRIEYIVVSFVWQDIVDAQLAYTQDVQAELQKLGERYPVIFADRNFTVFATNYSHQEPLETVFYDFGTMASNNLYGEGWNPPERANGKAFRWSNNTESTINVLLKQNLSYSIEFSVLNSASSDILNSLTLLVNDTHIGLQRTEADGTIIFRGTIPPEVIDKALSQTTLRIRINQVITVAEINEMHVKDGLAMSDLRISPISLAAGN